MTITFDLTDEQAVYAIQLLKDARDSLDSEAQFYDALIGSDYTQIDAESERDECQDSVTILKEILERIGGNESLLHDDRITR